MNLKPRPEAIVAVAFDSIGRGTVRVNGVDLSAVVQSTTIRARVGYATEVELEIPAAAITAELSALLRVYMVAGPDMTVHGEDVARRGGYAGEQQE